MLADPWTVLDNLLASVRTGIGLPLSLVVRLQTDPSIFRREWHVLDLTNVQLSCVLLLWVDPAELVRRMSHAAAFLNGEREVPGWDWPKFKHDPYGVGQVEMMTGWDWSPKDRIGHPVAESLHTMVSYLSADTKRRFFDEAETAVRVAVSHMMGRTDRLDATAVRVRNILLGDEPPSVRDIVVAAGRWR